MFAIDAGSLQAYGVWKVYLHLQDCQQGYALASIAGGGGVWKPAATHFDALVAREAFEVIALPLVCKFERH